MKKYILTVIGKISSMDLCKDLAIGLTPIVDSKNLKFQHANGVIVFHFASEVSKEEIFEYIGGILYGISDSYILTENNDNMTVSMPKDILEHLLDLENSTEGVPMFVNLDDVKNNINYDIVDEEEEEDIENLMLLLNKNKSIIKKPSLDQILDKISIKGFESLTDFEKDTLHQYSQN